jgi:hypothetical protein
MHELLPPDIARTIPPLYAQENRSDPIAYAKFFAPGIPMAWFVTEFDHDDQDTCYGYLIDGDEGEFLFFFLSVIQSRGPATSIETLDENWQPMNHTDIGRLPFVKRDAAFTPCPLSQARAEFERQWSQDEKEE